MEQAPFLTKCATETFRNIPNVWEDSGSDYLGTYQDIENAYANYRHDTTLLPGRRLLAMNERERAVFKGMRYCTCARVDTPEPV